MATCTKGYTFGATESVTNAKLHALVDSATITGIVNADIAAGAAIDFSKIAQTNIDGSKLTGLANIVSGAGVIPAANLPSQSATIIGTIYPIGSIYTSTLSTNPNTLLGIGTWVAFGEGRVLLGNGGGYTAGATGGAATKNLSHTHTVPASQAVWGTGTRADGKMCTATGESYSATVDAATGSGGSATQDIMPPYIVVYMWKRTA